MPQMDVNSFPNPSFRTEDPIRHAGRSSAFGGRIEHVNPSFRSELPVRHVGRSRAVVGI